MEAWQRTFDQLRALLRGLSPAQRVSLSIIGAIVGTGLGWLVYSSMSPGEEFLLGGKAFSAGELVQIQSGLKAAGLTQFKVTGNRISVPAQEADRYTAAALAKQTLPAQFAADFDRMQAKVNVFTSSEQRRELLEENRKARLSQILRSIPEIEEAIVEWDRPRQTSLFRPAPQLAAHVSVKPRDGRELSPELVQSLKQFVAGAIAGAQPDDVTVVDMNTTRVYGRRSPDEVAADRGRESLRQIETQYTSQITRALNDIADATVTVTVSSDSAPDDDVDPTDDFSNPRIITVSHDESRSRQPLPARPNRSVLRPVDTPSIQVNVSIPTSHYALLAREQGVEPGQSLETDSAYRATLANIKAETQREVRARVAKLLRHTQYAPTITIATHPSVDTVLSSSDASSARVTALPFELSFDDWRTKTGLAVCGSCVLFVWLMRRPSRATRFAALHPESQPSATDAEPSEPANQFSETAMDADLTPLEAAVASFVEQIPPAPMPQSQQIHPLEFLRELSAETIARLLQSEHPQTIALVAAALPPGEAANILHLLPDAIRWDVSQRLTRIGHIASDVLTEVAAGLKSRLNNQQPEWPEPAAVTGYFDNPPHPATSQPVATSSNASDTRSKSFPVIFDDLSDLDVRSLATLIESIDLRACAVALLDCPSAFKQAVFSKLPKHVSSDIKLHARQLGPIRLAEIAAAQQAIAEVAWNLTLRGLIQLPPHLDANPNRTLNAATL